MYITYNEQIWFESFVNHQKAARLTCRNMLLLLKQRHVVIPQVAVSSRRLHNLY